MVPLDHRRMNEQFLMEVQQNKKAPPVSRRDSFFPVTISLEFDASADTVAAWVQRKDIRIQT